MSNILRIEGLRLRRGSVDVLRGVSLHAERSEIVALLGLSGGGKTTILRSIAALERIDGGSIAVDDVILRSDSASRQDVKRLRQRVGMVFQHHSLFENLTALENVALALIHVGHQSPAAAHTRAETLLRSLGVDHRRDAYPRHLSGGEAQRVAIARALATDPPLLLMDEPTASLDPARRMEVGRIVRDLASAGQTIVVATHDDDFVREFASRAYVLADGEIVEEGDARAVLSNPQHAATRELLHL